MSDNIPDANNCVRHWTTRVDYQKNVGTYFASATADMIGTIYRMKGVTGFLALPQPIIDLGLIDINKARPYLCSKEYGLQSVEDYPFATGREGVWFRDPGKTHYVENRPRYLIGDVKTSDDVTTLEYMLATNFKQGGLCYPMLGFLIMGDLEDPEVARRVYLGEPFRHLRTPTYEAESHVVLVVGFNNTKEFKYDPYCVIKNSWGLNGEMGAFPRFRLKRFIPWLAWRLGLNN